LKWWKPARAKAHPSTNAAKKDRGTMITMLLWEAGTSQVQLEEQSSTCFTSRPSPRHGLDQKIWSFLSKISLQAGLVKNVGPRADLGSFLVLDHPSYATSPMQNLGFHETMINPGDS